MDFVLGARMMGGGFGGCTINLVKRSSFDAFEEMIKKRYFEYAENELPVYVVNLACGAKQIN
jgi:galactokinase